MSGKTALITGGSRGIGAEIARAYALAGMRVALSYRANEEAARATLASLDGSGHLSIQADVSDAEQVQRMVQQAVGALGRLDVLVNNAGVFEEQPFDMASYDDWQSSWRRVLDTNLMSAANASYWAVRQMRGQGGGKVIHVASRSAFRAETTAPAYAVSKAGMVNLTRCMARALAKDNVLAYCIAPGFVETAMARDSFTMQKDEILAQIPLGRVAGVKDVAGVALFLASDAANYLTGVTIDVNGGSYFH